ncbi:MAG: ABC transporter permease, partial [Lachnospiraceae bacterium]|nr:ABC transporter permease [Lachnospiraceae bacterium]
LSMWMRTRQKEFAVFLSLGSPKRDILFQTFTEAALLFLLSVLLAACLARILAGRAFPVLFASGELGALAAAKVEGRHLAALLLFGGALVLGSAGIAALPSLKNNPRDILSRMEE